MESRAKLLDHPAVHQMLIVLALGLLGGAALFDIFHIAGGGNVYAIGSYWLIPAGIATGVLAAVFGFADWTKIPSGTRAKRIASIYGIDTVLMVTLFAGSWMFRRLGTHEDPTTAAFGLSFAGFGLALVAGWLGGELVDRLGVGSDDGANVDAPSSLSVRSASGRMRQSSTRA
jgi:uncharacterized membrane protein